MGRLTLEFRGSFRNHRATVQMLAVLTAALALYWMTAVPYVGEWDPGEIQVMAYLGGIVHSTTYPLLSASVAAATRAIPFFEPAHAANLVNATYAAIAAVGVFAASRMLTRSSSAALLATAVFTTGQNTWTQAIQAVPFSLQGAVTVALLISLIRFDSRPSARSAAVVLFLTAISLTNHFISFFMVPASLGFLALRRPFRFPRFREWALYAAAIAAGLLPWLYVLRGLWWEIPVLQPSAVFRLNPDEIRFLIFGRPTEMIGGLDILGATVRTPGLLEHKWSLLSSEVLREFGWLWLIPAVLGLMLLIRRNARLGLWTLWVAGATWWFSLSCSACQSERYLIVIHALMAVWLAHAVAWAIREVPALVTAAGRRRAARLSRAAVPAMVVFLAAARLAVQLTGEAAANVTATWDHNAAGYRRAVRQIERMQPNAVYYTEWRGSWYERYVLSVRGARTDVEVVTVTGGSMGVDEARMVLDSGRPLYIQRTTPEYERRYEVVAEGEAIRVLRSP